MPVGRSVGRSEVFLLAKIDDERRGQARGQSEQGTHAARCYGRRGHPNIYDVPTQGDGGAEKQMK